MTNILLGILKAVGILLAVILALFLILTLILLLGPIGYRASGRYREEKDVSAAVSWLGFVLRGQANYREETGLLWSIKLFGIMLASNDEEFLRKKEEKGLKKEEIRRRRDEERRLKEEVPVNDETSAEKDEESVQTVESVLQQEKKPVQQKESSVKQEEEFSSSSSPMRDSHAYEESLNHADTQSENERNKKSFPDIIKEKIGRIKSNIQNLVQKIKSIIQKIKSIPVLIRSKITVVREKINRVLEIKDFFLGERNREGFEHILKNIKKMIIHILPGKIQGEIDFGVEDPYLMGQILTILSIFYPAYQDRLTIHPDFENPGFAGDFALRGRIIPGYLLWRVLVIICNREVRRIIKEGRQLIGGKTA